MSQEVIYLVFVRKTADDELQVIGAYKKEDDAKLFVVNNFNAFVEIFYESIGLYV